MKSRRATLVACVIASLLSLTLATTVAAQDSYYIYVDWSPGVGYTTGVNGYVDAAGDIEGTPGAEYLFFTGGPSYGGQHTAYVYRVETAGDPNLHPDNPDATGPIAPRTFTFVSSHNMGYYASGHDNAFYVDATGIYYGASNNAQGGVPGWATVMGGGIFHWDFNWNLLGCVVPTAAPGGTQTLARNPANGDWWVGTAIRQLYKWSGAAWVYQFTHPNLGGSHHDGMEVIGNSLFISDMTSDIIIQYRLDDFGNAIDPPGSPFNTFTYASGRNVEGMGYGPNAHIWISGWNSYTIYELGGGELQAWLEGIPDECISAGESFGTFDLDDYAGGLAEPVSWSWTGNVYIGITLDADNVVTVTYPEGWTGSETVTFTVTDAAGTSLSDDATFTVVPTLVILPIPDQLWPFPPFDLDYFVEGVDPAEVTWVASGMITLVIGIDPVTHVVTVVDAEDCTGIEIVTFTGTTPGCPGEEITESVDVVFNCLPYGFDIKPTSCPNPLNVRKGGVLPVAVLGGENADVMEIDPESLELEGVPPLRWEYADVATPVPDDADTCECTTEGPDGYLDLTVKFDTRSIVAALEAEAPFEDGETRILTLVGETIDGLVFEAYDCVRILDKMKGLVDVFAEEVPNSAKGDAVTEISLGGCYPNPFRSGTSISFSLSEEAQVSLAIYHISGRLVRTLMDRVVPAGPHSISWDGRDETGAPVASGVYFCRASRGTFQTSAKLVRIE